MLYNILEVCYDIYEDNEIIIKTVRIQQQFVTHSIFLLYEYVMKKYM